MTPEMMKRKEALENWFHYADGNVLDTELADLALAVREAIRRAKIEAYNDSAKVVSSGYSWPSVISILHRKAQELSE